MNSHFCWGRLADKRGCAQFVVGAVLRGLLTCYSDHLKCGIALYILIGDFRNDTIVPRALRGGSLNEPHCFRLEFISIYTDHCISTYWQEGGRVDYGGCLKCQKLTIYCKHLERSAWLRIPPFSFWSRRRVQPTCWIGSSKRSLKLWGG